MKNKNRVHAHPSNCHESISKTKHKRSGPSSFWMHDSKAIFNSLRLSLGETFLDLGCGPGDYALAASHQVGPSGKIIALDKWQYLIDGLEAEASSQRLKNIHGLTANITKELPVEDQSIDCCLLSTVLHSLSLPKVKHTLFAEIKRILSSSGRLAIIECKKEEQPFGPPVHLRISPQELETALKPFGFIQFDYRDLGYTYLVQFQVLPASISLTNTL